MHSTRSILVLLVFILMPATWAHSSIGLPTDGMVLQGHAHDPIAKISTYHFLDETLAYTIGQDTFPATSMVDGYYFGLNQTAVEVVTLTTSHGSAVFWLKYKDVAKDPWLDPSLAVKPSGIEKRFDDHPKTGLPYDLVQDSMLTQAVMGKDVIKKVAQEIAQSAQSQTRQSVLSGSEQAGLDNYLAAAEAAGVVSSEEMEGFRQTFGMASALVASLAKEALPEKLCMPTPKTQMQLVDQWNQWLATTVEPMQLEGLAVFQEQLPGNGEELFFNALCLAVSIKWCDEHAMPSTMDMQAMHAAWNPAPGQKSPLNTAFMNLPIHARFSSFNREVPPGFTAALLNEFQLAALKEAMKEWQKELGLSDDEMAEQAGWALQAAAQTLAALAQPAPPQAAQPQQPGLRLNPLVARPGQPVMQVKPLAGVPVNIVRPIPLKPRPNMPNLQLKPLQPKPVQLPPINFNASDPSLLIQMLPSIVRPGAVLALLHPKILNQLNLALNNRYKRPGWNPEPLLKYMLTFMIVFTQNNDPAIRMQLLRVMATYFGPSLMAKRSMPSLSAFSSGWASPRERIRLKPVNNDPDPRERLIPMDPKGGGDDRDEQNDHGEG